MRLPNLSRTQSILLAGDFIIFLLVTLAGFSTHQTMAAARARLWHNLIPWFLAWVLIAPFLGVFEEKNISQPRQLWRPFWAMILASPLGGFLRAIWLGSDVSPLFIVVFGGFAALGMLAWRAGYLLVISRRPTGG